MRTVLVLASLVLLTACGADEKRVAPTGSRDCLAVWNGDGNEANRARMAHEKFAVARVSGFTQIADFGQDATAEDRADAEREGCSYLFHDEHRYLTISGTWEDDRLLWGTPPTISGSWSPEQQANTQDNATLEADGKLGTYAPPLPPSDPKPALPTAQGPPPAWLQTDYGGFWLGYSTFCWKDAGCADFIAPSCQDTEHVPPITVDRDDLVTAHLGFDPGEVRLTYFGADHAPPTKADQQRVMTRRDPVWRVTREGSFALAAIAEGRGDASYVACFEFAP